MSDASVQAPRATATDQVDWRTIVLAVYAPSFLIAFAAGILIPVLPLYVRSLGASFAVVSLVVAAAGLGTLLSDVPAGVFLRRLGLRRAMIGGTGTLVVVGVLLGLVGFVPALIVIRLVSGVGSALWNISRLSYLAEEVPTTGRGRVLSTFGGVTRVGTFAGPAVGGLVAARFGLNAPFFVYAGAALLACLLAVVFVHDRAVEPVALAGEAPPSLHWRTVPRLIRLRLRELSTAGMAQVCAQMIRAGRQIIIPLYAAYGIGLGVSAVGTIVSLSAAVDMSLFYPAGLVMDRFGRRYAIVPSFGFLALGMALVPLTHSYLALLGATLVLGFGNGLGSGSMMTLGTDLAPPGQMREFLGIWRLIGDTGSTAGPVIVGTVASSLGLGVAAFALAGIGLLAAMLFLTVVQETHRPKKGASP
jgi:MFS family permease